MDSQLLEVARAAAALARIARTLRSVEEAVGTYKVPENNAWVDAQVARLRRRFDAARARLADALAALGG